MSSDRAVVDGFDILWGTIVVIGLGIFLGVTLNNAATKQAEKTAEEMERPGFDLKSATEIYTPAGHKLQLKPVPPGVLLYDPREADALKVRNAFFATVRPKPKQASSSASNPCSVITTPVER